jgi:hypothetical protein
MTMSESGHRHPSMSVAERFAEFLRTTELPGGLLAPDVFCDLNVPEWRFQLQGAESFAAWCKEEAPHGSEVSLGRVREGRGTVTVETVMVTSGVYARNLWLLGLDDAGLIDEIVFYCTGPWSKETIARQAREAPMIRP